MMTEPKIALVTIVNGMDCFGLAPHEDEDGQNHQMIKCHESNKT